AEQPVDATRRKVEIDTGEYLLGAEVLGDAVQPDAQRVCVSHGSSFCIGSCMWARTWACTWLTLSGPVRPRRLPSSMSGRTKSSTNAATRRLRSAAGAPGATNMPSPRRL